MLIASFLSYQHYRICVTYVQLYVLNQVEKNFPTFWWIYTTFGRGVLSRAYSLFSGADFALRFVLWQKKKY